MTVPVAAGAMPARGNRRRRLFVVAPLPPPTTGQSLVTQILLERLGAEPIEIELVNTSAAGAKGRLVKYLRTAFRLLKSLRRGDVLYVSLFANAGMWFSLAFCLVGRLRSNSIIVHHHTRQHLEERRLAMTLICRTGGRPEHLVLCSYMAERLRSTYPVSGDVRVLSNAFTSAPAARPPGSRDTAVAGETIRLGHLANLSIDKGLGRAIEIFEMLLADGLDARLEVAGPCADDESRDLVAATAKKHPDRFRYWGFVSGDAKALFFRNLDAFLFLSLYRNEAEPLVLLEALSAGCAVVAFEVGCIGTLKGRSPTLILSPEGEYRDAAKAFLAGLPARRQATTSQAERSFADLRATSEDQLAALVADLKRRLS